MTEQTRPIADFHELALALGGSPDSFIGLLLRLIAKADPAHRERLALAFPREVGAWALWMVRGPRLTVAELLRLSPADPWRDLSASDIASLRNRILAAGEARVR